MTTERTARPPGTTGGGAPAPHRGTEGGRLLAKALAARGLSWAEAGRMLGTHPNYVRKLIVGERKPRAPLAERIRKLFGVPPGEWQRPPRGAIVRRPSGPVPGGHA